MKNTLSLRLSMSLCAFLLASAAVAGEIQLMLSGNNEVPPVSTLAGGSGDFAVATDMTISGSVRTDGIEATMAHIHMGKAGSNGPVAIGLVREGNNMWKVPAGTKLTDTQYRAFMDGGLYVNVHSAVHPGGELRAQLTPAPMAMPGKPDAMPSKMPSSMPMERKGY